jgi:ferredoxin-type protein NapH
VNSKRSLAEKIFIVFFIPAIIIFYLIYKYPLLFVSAEEVAATFYWGGKSTSFWYGTAYTFFVCFICIKQLVINKSPYSKKKNVKLSSYQKWKWISIMFSQFVLFYFIPYLFPYFITGESFFNDQYTPINKDAYVYVYNGFTSVGGFIYIFVLVPLTVWIFGKRYCSWFCACGNLAETAGITKWGRKWVINNTPRGEKSIQLEIIQICFLILAIIFGFCIFLDTWKMITAANFISSWQYYHDLVVDLIFGALVGVGAYPFLGTRVWCRYGCPLAQLMKLTGKWTKSKAKIIANDKCIGTNLCTQICPMGIDVASYAHKDKVPIMGEFGLLETPCISCGGCVDICPVQALTFQTVLNPFKKY